MKILRAVSVHDYIEWYLRREFEKGNVGAVPQSSLQRQLLMEATHSGKLWPDYLSCSWSLVEISPPELPNLLILGSRWTEEERLVRKGVVRSLGNAVSHAKENNYFGDTETRPKERARHQAYYRTYQSQPPTTSELGRVVIRTLRGCEKEEAKENKDIVHYLHDGFGRLLPYLSLVKESRFEGIRVEAFLATE